MAPVDGAGGQMKHEIEHPRAGVAPGEPAVKLLGLAGDARKRGDGGEQGIEKTRPHGGDIAPESVRTVDGAMPRRPGRRTIRVGARYGNPTGLTAGRHSGLMPGTGQHIRSGGFP